MPSQYLAGSHSCGAFSACIAQSYTLAPQLEPLKSRRSERGLASRFGTLVVNLVGSALIGVFSGVVGHVSNSATAAMLQQFLVVGIRGGLTTFSSFSLQTYNLIAEGRWLSALANIIFSTGFCFVCLAIGWQFTQWLNV